MTTKADFTNEEWIRVRRAPMIAGAAISLADPGGPIEMSKETMASIRSAMTPPAAEELLVAVANELKTMSEAKQNPMGDFKLQKDPAPGAQILDELRGATGIVKEKATPAEAQAFGEWLVETAQSAANAAKEGGFMGIGAELVSQREADMLDQVRSAVGVA
jgi:hypothetical protein